MAISPSSSNARLSAAIDLINIDTAGTNTANTFSTVFSQIVDAKGSRATDLQTRAIADQPTASEKMSDVEPPLSILPDELFPTLATLSRRDVQTPSRNDNDNTERTETIEAAPIDAPSLTPDMFTIATITSPPPETTLREAVRNTTTASIGTSSHDATMLPQSSLPTSRTTSSDTQTPFLSNTNGIGMLYRTPETLSPTQLPGTESLISTDLETAFRKAGSGLLPADIPSSRKNLQAETDTQKTGSSTTASLTSDTREAPLTSATGLIPRSNEHLTQEQLVQSARSKHSLYTDNTKTEVLPGGSTKQSVGTFSWQAPDKSPLNGKTSDASATNTSQTTSVVMGTTAKNEIANGLPIPSTAPLPIPEPPRTPALAERTSDTAQQWSKALTSEQAQSQSPNRPSAMPPTVLAADLQAAETAFSGSVQTSTRLNDNALALALPPQTGTPSPRNAPSATREMTTSIGTVQPEEKAIATENVQSRWPSLTPDSPSTATQAVPAANLPLASTTVIEPRQASSSQDTTIPVRNTSRDGDIPSALAASTATRETANLAAPQEQFSQLLAGISATTPHQTTQDNFPVATQEISTPLQDKQWSQDLGGKIVWMAKSDQQQVQLSLNPPELGPIQVTLDLGSDTASANFTSPHAEVRQAIEEAMPRLREMLADAGISLGQTSVGSEPRREQQGENTPSGNSARETGDKAILGADLSRTDEQPSPSLRTGRGMVDLFA